MSERMKQVSYISMCVCAFLIGMCPHVYAQAPGSTCFKAIPLGDNYSAPITGPKTIWYSAWTYDLPISVYFVPQNPSDPKPEVEMDFSCTSGVYTDSIICSLFCKNSGSGIQLDMPHRPALKEGKTDDGRFCYYLAIGKEYRDLLLKTGIDYNVEAFVKVTYKSAGTISIAPDNMFTNCMSAKFMHIGDTVQVKAKDKDRHVIVPYVQWQQDSIRYIWNGTAPCNVVVAGECEFDPTDMTNGRIIELESMQSVDTAKVTSKDMMDWVKFEENEAGMYYAKFYTTGTGVMKVERVPQAPPRGGATLLRYDKITPVPADSNALYAIPCTWDTATIFTTPTDYTFRMYIGVEPDFHLSEAIDSCRFHTDDSGHWYGFSSAQMQALWTHTTEQYLYVRFVCNAKTTIKPAIWEMSDCMKAKNVHEIYRPSTTVNVEKGSYGAVYYRFYYREWAGGDMTFKWKSSASTCPTFIGENCTFPANRNSDQVLKNKEINKNSSWIVAASDLERWKTQNKVDEDGYLYIRFNPSSPGTMVISTDAPEEMDPAPETYPAATIAVTCDDEPTAAGQAYTVRVSKTQTLSLDSGAPWLQNPNETHSLTLSPGTHILQGEDGEIVRIEVK